MRHYSPDSGAYAYSTVYPAYERYIDSFPNPNDRVDMQLSLTQHVLRNDYPDRIDDIDLKYQVRDQLFGLDRPHRGINRRGNRKIEYMYFQ